MRVQKAMRVIDAHTHTHRLAELAQVTHLILSQSNLRVIKENILSTFLRNVESKHNIIQTVDLLFVR